MKFRLSGHGAYKTEYHVVWITKYRRKLFNPGLASYLKKIIYEEAKIIPGVEIDEINVQEDHVHMMVEIPPKYSVSEVVRILKGGSARVIRQRIKYLSKMHTRKDEIWSPGYFVSTVGINENIIRNYVKHQRDRDSGQAKLDL